MESFSENFVVILATAIAAFDVLFILVAVPESLPQGLSPNYYKTFSWEQADPFAVKSLSLYYKLNGKKFVTIFLILVVAEKNRNPPNCVAHLYYGFIFVHTGGRGVFVYLRVHQIRK